MTARDPARQVPAPAAPRRPRGEPVGPGAPLAGLHQAAGNRAVQRALAALQRDGAVADPAIAQSLAGTIGNRELARLVEPARQVQRRLASAGGADDPREVRAAAARGTRGPAAALPHAAAIQRSFGRHDVGGIRAHLGAEATAGARAMGAAAFATGDAVGFAAPPGLFTAAHEAAHVIQQRAGVQLAGGVGSAGDAYERHADAVAARVVRGASAEALLGPVAGGGARGAVQRKLTDAGAVGEGVSLWTANEAARYLEGKGVSSVIASATASLAKAIDPEQTYIDQLKRPIGELVHAALVEETMVAANDDHDHDFAYIAERTRASLDSLAEQLAAIQRNFDTARDKTQDPTLVGTLSSESRKAAWYQPWGALAVGRVHALSLRHDDAEADAEIRALIEFTSSLVSDADPEEPATQAIVLDIARILHGRHAHAEDLERAIGARFVREPDVFPNANQELNARAQGELRSEKAEPPSVAPLPVRLDHNLYAIIASSIARTGLAERPLLNAIATLDGEALTRLAFVLRFIPKQMLREQFQALLARPEDLARINEKLFSLVHIDVNASGTIHALASPVARELLFASKVPAKHTAAWGATAERLSAPAPSETPPPGLPEKLGALIGSPGAQALGRTVVVSDPDLPNHSYAIKLLKAEESTDAFARELQLQGFLHSSDAPPLRSLIPTPLGLHQITEEQWGTLSTKILQALEAAQVQARERGEPDVPPLALNQGPQRLSVMAYRAHDSYFTYQHGGGLGKAPKPNFDQSRDAFFHDALTLLRYGIAFPQLIDLNHNSDRIYNWMIDIMRVYSGIQGMGKIANWKGAARYPNLRASGLADLGDVELLAALHHRRDEYAANENESAVGRVWTTTGPQRDKLLLAQYLGNYLLSAVLVEAHQFFVTDAPQLREALPGARGEVKAALIGVLGHTFRSAMAALSEVFGGRKLPPSLITDGELDGLAEQMLYFLGGEFVPDAHDALLEPAKPDPEGRRETPKASNRFDARLKELFPKIEVPPAPIKPLKEQRASVGYARQVLGTHGLHSVEIGESDDAVTPQHVANQPAQARKIDLGFLNGPQPLAELQLILYKLVSYAILSLSE